MMILATPDTETSTVRENINISDKYLSFSTLGFNTWFYKIFNTECLDNGLNSIESV